MAQGNRWTAIRAHNFVLVNSLGVLPSQSQYETQLRQVVKAEERESPLSHLLSSKPPDDGVETVLVTLLSLPPFSKSPLFPFLMFLLNLEKTWREKAASTKHTTAALKCKSQWQIRNQICCYEVCVPIHFMFSDMRFRATTQETHQRKGRENAAQENKIARSYI